MTRMRAAHPAPSREDNTRHPKSEAPRNTANEIRKRQKSLSIYFTDVQMDVLVTLGHLTVPPIHFSKTTTHCILSPEKAKRCLLRRRLLRGGRLDGRLGGHLAVED